MLEKLKAFLDPGRTPERVGPDQRELACAALLVEAAGMDERFDAAERRTILALLGRRFGLDPEEAGRLLEAGRDAVGESVSLYRFTRTLNDGWTIDERGELIQLLWQVAYADGELDPFEDALIRRVAGLLHVSDQVRGKARKRALRTHSPDQACGENS